MACHYYRESKADGLIGCCNDGLAEIPSEKHENCMCRSVTGIYASFCPIYAKFEKEELNGSKTGVLRALNRFVGILIYTMQLGFLHRHSKRVIR